MSCSLCPQLQQLYFSRFFFNVCPGAGVALTGADQSLSPSPTISEHTLSLDLGVLYSWAEAPVLCLLDCDHGQFYASHLPQWQIWQEELPLRIIIFMDPLEYLLRLSKIIQYIFLLLNFQSNVFFNVILDNLVKTSPGVTAAC